MHPELLIVPAALALAASYFGVRRLKALPAPAAPSALSDDLSELKHALSKLQYEEGAEKLGEQAIGQFRQAQEGYRVFRGMLEERLEPSEVTFDRYDSAARRVRDAVIDQLRQVSEAAQSWLIARAGSASEERLKPGQDELERISALLAANERALAELSRVTAAIQRIHTSKSGGPAPDLEGMIGELEELAARAKRYSS